MIMVTLGVLAQGLREKKLLYGANWQGFGSCEKFFPFSLDEHPVMRVTWSERKFPRFKNIESKPALLVVRVFSL